ncbi:MAG: lipoyl(octanoyl) transferase LipB [Pseudomonadota bacterium]
MRDVTRDLTQQPIIEWQVSRNLVSYPEAQDLMQRRVCEIQAGTADPLIWLLEHVPLYTMGTSAKRTDILSPERCPVYGAGRGGQVTYHGPGQRVGYVLMDLKRQQDPPDLRAYIFKLEQWLIDTLAVFQIKAERREGRRGLWVVGQNGVESKIAAVGVRVQKWVTSHGVALNLNPDLSYFTGIVPCGLAGYGVTSMHNLGVTATLDEVDAVLLKTFSGIFSTPGPRIV